MASSTQKKTTTKKSGSRSGSRTAKGKQPQKRPIRREVGGVILLVLALCVLVSYCGVQAILIDLLAKLLKGLFGYGYWLAGPAMLLAGGILLLHRGRPVTLRATCALLLPLLAGALFHTIFAGGDYALNGWGVLKNLWTAGLALKAGGAVSGLLAEAAVLAVSKVVSLFLFGLLLAVLLLAALHVTPSAVLEMVRNRPEYEEEPEPTPAVHIAPAEPPQRRGERQSRPAIDIPLDGEEPSAQPEEESGRFTGFFRHKSDKMKTPDQVLSDKEAEQAALEPAPSPARAKAAPTPAPVAEEVSVPEPAPAAPAAPPAPAAGKKAVAQEVAAATAAVTAEIEQKLTEDADTYQFPPITLLQESREENYAETGAELRNNSRRLAETLTSFGVDATAGDVVHGPSVTRYEFVLDQGVKLSKITNLSDDIALAWGLRRADRPHSGQDLRGGHRGANKQVTPVLIRDVIESRSSQQVQSGFRPGKGYRRRNIVGDIERLPHVLIAGTTGSGKSVCTNSLIVSLLYKSTPDEVRFIMVDPKMVELAPYNGIPHLLIPVVTDPKKAAGALQWAVFEMMKRYKTFSEHGVKKLEEFNRLARASEDLETLPSVVVVIDELADLMLVAAKEVEESICRVAQMGRAAGVHLVIATQRPSADVITGLMKANIPSRIAFAVASSLESRIILDNTGAEKLVGKGDMLYAPLGQGKPTRVQGCFISPEEIERVVKFVKQSGEAHYSDEVMAKIEESMQKEKAARAPRPRRRRPERTGDELLPAAVEVVLETGQASVSMLQRRLKLGYSRAARLVDQMEERGIVGPFEGSKPRQLLITRAQWQEMQMGGAPAPEADEPPFPTEEET
ncbi:MAG: DNA translocase FtsK [Dysosmobacter welbionis]